MSIAVQEDLKLPIGFQHADPLSVQPPSRQKKSKSRPKAAAASGSHATALNLTQLPKLSQSAALALHSSLPDDYHHPSTLDPLGMANERSSASGHLPPILPPSSSRDHGAQDDLADELAVSVSRSIKSSRRKGGLRVPKNEEASDDVALPVATEGGRR